MNITSNIEYHVFFSCKMFKRAVTDVPRVAPVPAANTADGQKVDLILAADETKRRRLADPPSATDAHLVATEQAKMDAFTGRDQILQAIHQMSQQLNAMNRQFDQRLQLIENCIHPRHQTALFENSCVRHDATAIVPVPRITDNTLPPNFPATRGDLKIMNGVDIDTFLDFYQLPVDGMVAERRRRLAIHCHVRIW